MFWAITKRELSWSRFASRHWNTYATNSQRSETIGRHVFPTISLEERFQSLRDYTIHRVGDILNMNCCAVRRIWEQKETESGHLGSEVIAKDSPWLRHFFHKSYQKRHLVMFPMAFALVSLEANQLS
jgi:hypothetical protein